MIDTLTITCNEHWWNLYPNLQKRITSKNLLPFI